MEQDKRIRDLIIKYEDDICYLQQMHIYSMSTYEKNYYSEQMKKATNEIIQKLENTIYTAPAVSHNLSKESDYSIEQSTDGDESTEEYQSYLGKEFIIPSQPNVENGYHIRSEEEAENDFLNNVETNENMNCNNNTNAIKEKSFTLKELAEYSGTNDKPPYVAIHGIVYDMSNIGPWSGGTHFGLLAGNNLTDQFMRCHLDATSILEKLTQVGKLVL